MNKKVTISNSDYPNLNVGDLVYLPHLVDSVQTVQEIDCLITKLKTPIPKFKPYKQNPLILFYENKDNTMSSEEEYIKSYFESLVTKLQNDGRSKELIVKTALEYFSKI